MKLYILVNSPAYVEKQPSNDYSFSTRIIGKFNGVETHNFTSPGNNKKTAKVVAFVGKLMLTLFFDNRGVVYSGLTSKRNSAVYCETLKKKKKTEKDDKRPTTGETVESTYS